MLWCLCGQRTTCQEESVLFFVVWVSAVELRLAGLVASTFPPLSHLTWPIYDWLCVGNGMHAGMSVCMYICESKLKDQTQISDVFPYHFPPYFWRQGFLVNLELTKDYLVSNPLGSFCFCFPSTGIKDVYYHTWLLHGYRRSKLMYVWAERYQLNPISSLYMRIFGNTFRP